MMSYDFLAKQQEFLEIWNDFDEEKYEEYKKLFNALCTRHRTDPDCPAPLGRLFELLMERDARVHSKDDGSLEAFRLYIVQRLPINVVSLRLRLSKRQVFELIRKTKERMFLYLFGIDALKR